MSTKDHQERDGICLWDHEPWPCSAARLIAEAWLELAEDVRPLGAEPRGSVENVDVEYARWETRNDIVEEIEEKAADLLVRRA